MTRKDYKLLAKAMAEALQDNAPVIEYYEVSINKAINKLCDALLVDNSKFDKAQFLNAVIAYQKGSLCK